MIQIGITIVTSIMLYLGWLVKRKTEQIKIMENQLCEKKYEAYNNIITVLYDVFKKVTNETKIDYKKISNKIFDSKKDLLMYSSDEVFNKFNNILCLSKVVDIDNNSTKMLKAIIEFILSIRKDMQGKKTNLSEREIIINLTQSEEEANEFFLKFRDFY